MTIIPYAICFLCGVATTRIFAALMAGGRADDLADEARERELKEWGLR